MTDWKSIETAPKDGSPISAKMDDDTEMFVQWRDHDRMPNGPGWIDDHGRYRKPIKWNQNYGQDHRI